jgi:hypothetical protein
LARDPLTVAIALALGSYRHQHAGSRRRIDVGQGTQASRDPLDHLVVFVRHHPPR